MGHQVNFYALLEDYAQIEAEIRLIEPLVILYDRSPVAAPRVAPALQLKDETGMWLFYYLVREVDLAAVITKPVGGQDYWTIEDFQSPVIKLSGSFFDGKILRRGRFYYMAGAYDTAGRWVERSEGFRKWAAAVFRATKKCLRRMDGEYIGPAAARWLETSGGKLVV